VHIPVAPHRYRSQSYGASPAVWDHMSQVNAPHLNPSHAGRYLIYLPRRDGRLSWPWCWLYILWWFNVRRLSPVIQVVTLLDSFVIFMTTQVVLRWVTHRLWFKKNSSKPVTHWQQAANRHQFLMKCIYACMYLCCPSRIKWNSTTGIFSCV